MNMILLSKLGMRALVLLCVLLLLSACITAKTPQEVTMAFWNGVVANQPDEAVEHSTLDDVRQYDAFSRDWSGYEPSLGRVVIDGAQASVVTTLARPGDTADRSVEVVTYLVRQDEAWKVDYARTEAALRGPFGSLFEQLDRLGKTLAGQFEAASGDLALEMERLGAELEQLSATVGQRAEETIDRYGEQLRQSIDELAESIGRALEEERLSNQDRRTLREVRDDLNDDSDSLARPTAQAIADSGKDIAAARRQLDTIDDPAVEQYKTEWRQWEERIERDIRRMLDDLSAGRTN